MTSKDKDSRGIFIAGTDTNVGKTAVMSGMVSVMRKHNIDAVPMKPVQTGCLRKGQELIAPDLEWCLTRSEMKVSPAQQKLMCPYRFEIPCSPHLAAEIAHETISLAVIESAYNKLAKQHDLVIVEGAGGLLVPLDKDVLMIDLIKLLTIPVILVARAGLGTINHTLLSLRELKKYDIKVIGVILNEVEPVEFSEIILDNIKTIKQLSNIPVISHIPYSKELPNLNEIITKQIFNIL